jgi:hypothetical protein
MDFSKFMKNVGSWLIQKVNRLTDFIGDSVFYCRTVVRLYFNDLRLIWHAWTFGDLHSCLKLTISGFVVALSGAVDRTKQYAKRRTINRKQIAEAGLYTNIYSWALSYRYQLNKGNCYA